MKNVGSFTFILVANVVLTLLRYNLKTRPIDQHTDKELTFRQQISQACAQQHNSLLFCPGKS